MSCPCLRPAAKSIAARPCRPHPGRWQGAWLGLAALGASLAAIGGSSPLAACPRPTAEFVIPNTQVIDFVSSVNGHRYRINVALPLRPPPPKGYRVLYAFDGNAYFGTLTEAVRANGNATDVVVVGLGYPDTDAFVTESARRHRAAPATRSPDDPVGRARLQERLYDLTLPASDAVLALQSGVSPPPFGAHDVGGVDDFLATLEADVKPRVAALARIDRDNQVLFGHSLGGLAVLRALFTEPSAFRAFIAASPSIWWNDRAVLAGERGFAAAVAAGKATPRVLITIGAEESSLALPLPLDTTLAARKAMIARNRMVANARDLARRLGEIRGAPGYEVDAFARFDRQGHGISVWPAIGRAVEFAFQRSQQRETQK